MREVRAEALVLRADAGANAGVLDQIPSGEVDVAPVKRIAKRALNGVRSHKSEKGGGSVWKSRRRARFDVDEQGVPIGSAQVGERLPAPRSRISVECRQAGAIRISRRGQGAPEGAIDVARRTSLDRADALIVGGNQPAKNCVERPRFGRRQI